MKILLAGKSLAEQKHITEEAAKNPLPRLRKEQSQHGALALAGGALLSAGGAAKIKLPTGKAGLLTGLAVGLYGLMLGGNARAEGLKQQKAVSKLNLEHPARGVNRQTAAQNSFAAQHAQYGLWSAIKSGITAGFNPPATPARRTAPHGDAAMKQIARDGFGKAVMDAISIMPPEKRSSEPPKPRHVWDDNARKAAALARRTNAAYGKASADARNRTPPAKPPPQPTTKTKPTKGRDKQAAAPETGGSGKMKVTRNGTTYYRQRSKREKADRKSGE